MSGGLGRPGSLAELTARRRRGGFLLAEAVVAGTLVLLAVQTAWWATATQGAVSARVVDRARALDEARLVRHVLASEARNGKAGLDWEVADGEVRLRAFRGLGVGCSVQPPAGWGVAVSGHRNPNPDKDSVLVLTTDGAWRPVALVRRSSGRNLDCPGLSGFSAEVWHLDPEPSGPVVGLYFERGAYRFSGGAFRYRQRTRWEPLTSTALAGDSAGFSSGADRVEAYLGVPGQDAGQDAGADMGPNTGAARRRWTAWGRR